MTTQAHCKCGTVLDNPRGKVCDSCKAETIKRKKRVQKESYKCNRLDLPKLRKKPVNHKVLDRELLATDLAHITRVFCDIGQSSPCVSLRDKPEEFARLGTAYMVRDMERTVRREAFY